jgi:predicted aspartyl protease
MGEVRAKVKLTNSIDEGLVRRGLMSKDEVRTYETDALVDTGAVSPVLPSFVVQQLGLQIVGKRNAQLADSVITTDVTESVGFDVQGRRVDLQALVTGDEVIIGQIVLEVIDMQVDCMNHRLIPNPAHPDQPIIKLKKATFNLDQTPNAY